MAMQRNPSSVRSGIFRPYGALAYFGFRFYKDFAPDGAGCRSQTRAPVDRILAAKARDAGADVSAWEREIDQLVYALYGLTPEEIKIVEGAAK